MKKVFLMLLCAACVALTGCNEEPTGLKPMDYSLVDNWMIKSPILHEVDMFYIYPTSVDPSCTTLISPVDDYMRDKALYSYQQNAECFSGYTNVYAPYYRQVSMVGISQSSTYEEFIGMCRENEPWCDLNAALDYYFTYINTSRPVLFASHSQGSANMHIVMDTYMKQHPELKSRIVAVYAIGMCATQDWCDQAGIPFAKGEEDTGCYITWNTEGPDCVSPNIVLGTNSLVINPLNWKTDDTYAGIEMNKGSLKANAEGILEKVAGRADAQIDMNRRSVICTTDTAYLEPSTTFGDKSFHFEDGALYYESMKANGKKRITTYLGHEPR